MLQAVLRLFLTVEQMCDVCPMNIQQLVWKLKCQDFTETQQETR